MSSHIPDLRRLVSDEYTRTLGTTPASPAVTFWDLGGTSFQLAALLARLAHRTGISVPVSRLFRDTSIDGVVTAFSGHSATGLPAPTAGWVPALVRNCVLRQRLSPQDTAGNCVMLWELDGETDRDALRQAVQELVARHDALRSSFSMRGHIASASDTPGGTPLLMSFESREEALKEVRALLEEPLAPSRGVVQRSVVAEVGPASTLVGFVVHHAAFDGYSESLVAEELGHLYRHCVGEESCPMAEQASLAGAYETLSTTRMFPDFEHQRSRAASYLAGLPDLPLDALHEDDAPSSADSRPLQAEMPCGGRLRQRAAELGVPYFSLLATAYARTLQAETGASDVVFGVPVNRRMGLPLARVIGNFVSMLPVRIGLPPDGSFEEAVSSVRAGVVEGFGLMDLDFGDILGMLPPASKGRAYRHVFALQDNPAPRLDVPEARASFIRQPYSQLANDTMLEVWPTGTGYSDESETVVLSYRPSAVSDEVARAVLDTFLNQLIEAAEHGS
jgi:mycobactin peptide synthetase MbtE